MFAINNSSLNKVFKKSGLRSLTLPFIFQIPMQNMLRNLLNLLCAVALSMSAFAQTPISGVINRYAVVTTISNCEGSVVVTNATGFEVGMAVLLVQMKGATINTSNSANFGDLTTMGAAGRCERAVISALSGNTITFQNTILNTYDPAGKVQLVSIPFYDDAVVTATLSAAPWNGQTGGVLALEVGGSLLLQADLEANGKGFRGGIADITDENNCSWLVNINGYAYGPNNWRGAAKGEGIADFIAAQQTGRGAQANGGGGGNDHNSGGGGGGHLSAGGLGGNNDEPSFFGCDGFFPGRGGKAVANLTGRFYLGGGGGAGHENNGVGTDGGNGGGIILLSAAQLIANGFAIRANGADAANTAGEGAGGGGAGGIILLDAASVSGALTLETRGGKGGNINNAGAERCAGPGGGGSGGRILLPAGIIAMSTVSGGAAGIGSNSASCATGPNGAEAGSAGFVEPLQSIPQSNQPNMAPTISEAPTMLSACIGDALEIPLTVQGGTDLAYQWQVNTGAGFVNIQDGAVYSGTGTSSLSILNATAAMSGYVFRLQVGSDCFLDVFSEGIALTVSSIPMADFMFVNDELNVSFSNLSQNASGYLWDFGDGNTSAELNPQHYYTGEGEYFVRLAAFNACDTVFAEALVQIFTTPEAAFGAENVQGCAPRLVQFFNQSSGSYDELLWFFPGGEPGTSALENPTVIYSQTGTYDVMLVAVGLQNNDTITLTGLVSVLPQPMPVFSYMIDGNLVIFSNASTEATQYNWDFGDNTTSNAVNPQHTYAADGAYTVTLNAQNAFCGSAISQTIVIGANAVEENLNRIGMAIFPNPTSDQVFVKSNDNQSLIHCHVHTVQGVELLQASLSSGASLDLEYLPAGCYYLHVEQAGRMGVARIIKH